MPTTSRAVPRERLHALLDAGSDRPLTWICAAPGSGKTTLAAAWIASRSLPCAWIQADPDDRDPATLFHYLREALAGLGARTARRLPVFTEDDRRDVGGHARRLLRQAAITLHGPWMIVVDNIQEIAEDSPVHRALAEALVELPPGCRLVAISRGDPPPEYALVVARSQCLAIDSKLLRFTREESQALFERSGAREHAEALLNYTGGWAAGLVLVLAAQAYPSTALDDIQSGPGGPLFDYFAAGILARMPAGHGQLLEQVALFPGATATMAIALTGDANAGRVLADLARRGLFVDRRPGAEAVFVLHALFRSFLLARLTGGRSASALAALQCEAARLLERSGQREAAVRLYLDAHASEAACDLIAAVADRMIDDGRAALVHEWISMLPGELAGRASIRRIDATCIVSFDPVAAASAFAAAYDGFDAAGDDEGALRAAADAAESIVFEGTAHRALDRWLPVFERLVPGRLAAADAPLDPRVLPGVLGAFAYRRLEDPLIGPLLDRAEAVLAEPRMLRHRSLVGTMAFVLILRGEVPRARRILDRVDSLRLKDDAAPLAMLRWYSLAIHCRAILGDLAAARIAAEEALAFLDRHPQAPQRGRILIRASQAMWINREFTTARALLARARDAMKTGDATNTAMLDQRVGMLAFSDGDATTALGYLGRSSRVIEDAGSVPNTLIMVLHRALVAAEAGDWAEAGSAMAWVRRHPALPAVPHNGYSACLVAAWIALLRGDADRCSRELREAFRISNDIGIEFEAALFVVPQRMSALCAHALAHSIAPSFVRALIRRWQLPPPPAAGPEWPWPARLHVLDTFSLEIDGRDMVRSRKASRRLHELLELVALAGARGLPASQVMHALWPEADGDAARGAFETTLHRARRLLGDETAIRLHAGVIALDPARVWCDAWALECVVAEVDKATRQAVSIIDGTVLAGLEGRLFALCGRHAPDDDPVPAVRLARERLRTQCLRALADLGACHQARGDHDRAARTYQRAIEIAPLAEEMYRRLMACHLQAGRRAEAWDTWRRCRDHLSIVLGIRPSRETEAMAERLRDPGPGDHHAAP